MPDSKDTGEKPWPTKNAWRFADSESIFWPDKPHVPDPGRTEAEIYLPLQVIRERLQGLLDDAERRARGGNLGPVAEARAFEAALAAFSKEEGP